MIIDSPIISGSYAASGSLNQLGNVVISGSLTVTGSIIGTASFASTASYLSGYVSPFPFTGSAIISGSLDVTGSLKVTGSITSTSTITAQTLVVQTVSSSVIYSSGSNVFGNDLANTQVLTGSVSITGSLAVNGSNAILTNQTSSMSASYAVSASYALNSTSASFATTSSFSLNVPVTASFANTATSSSFASTASFSLNVPVTSSYANNATSASFATTASYLTGYISPFPFTGSAIISGSLVVTGSVAASNLQGTGVRYLVADSSGSVTAQTASAAIKQTQAFTSSANQTSFTIDNGYTTGLVDVFINGTKLAPGVEFTDTTGTVITLATGSNSGDLVEFVKYFPASGVTNNALRQQTTFTASAGQTVFSASYTPGLLDIFYNGSRLSNNEYTANNGTFFTLATGSVAGDILDVFVYSYQVGAFSGIGGVGVASQVAYFDTTNSITGSPNFTISGSTMTVTGSLIVSGSGTFTNIGPAVFSGSLTSTAGFTGSFSGTATSASFASTASFVANAQTASFVANAQSASYVLNAISSSFATRAVTASYADSLTVAGTLTAQTLVVQTITSSVVYSSGSNIFGNNISNTQTFTGSMSVSGSLDVNSGSFYVGSNNQIGVNTNSPQSQFVVAAKTGNSASVEINLNNSGYGRIFAYNRASTTAANLVLNDPGGNVGIGVTSVTEGKLQVNGIIAAMNAGADGTLETVMKFGNAGFPGTQHHRTRASTSASGPSNLLVFETSTATANTFNTNQLVLRGDGNVGIGTSSPNTALSFANTTGNKIDFYNDGTARYSVQVNGGELRLYTSQTNDVISLYAGNVIGLVNNNGRVGIGITPSSTTKFHVNATGVNQEVSAVEIAISGSGTFQRGVRMLNGGMVAGESLLYMVGRNSVPKNTGQVYFHYAGDGSNSNRLSLGMYAVDDIFNITALANVGIGTTAPNHKLDVNGNINIPGTNSIVFNNELGSWGITARTTTSTANLGANLKNIIICGGGSNEGIAFTGVGTGAAAMEVRNDGAVWVKGTLTKGGGSFRIDHPLPEKKDTHHLYHSFIEGPKADLIYRGKINLVNGTASVNIDEISTMTEGTFELLTRDAQCFVNNLSGWDLVKGNITGNTLTITSQNTESTDEISWMVVAERNDEWFRDSEMTDSDGNTIVEKLKPIIEEII
jgi:hypothetical protein